MSRRYTCLPSVFFNECRHHWTYYCFHLLGTEVLYYLCSHTDSLAFWIMMWYHSLIDLFLQYLCWSYLRHMPKSCDRGHSLPSYDYHNEHTNSWYPELLYIYVVRFQILEKLLIINLIVLFFHNCVIELLAWGSNSDNRIAEGWLLIMIIFSKKLFWTWFRNLDGNANWFEMIPMLDGKDLFFD